MSKCSIQTGDLTPAEALDRLQVLADQAVDLCSFLSQHAEPTPRGHVWLVRVFSQVEQLADEVRYIELEKPVIDV